MLNEAQAELNVPISAVGYVLIDQYFFTKYSKKEIIFKKIFWKLVFS